MPEEVNRRLTDHISSLFFCPSQVSVTNLATEGIETGVHQTGDVNFDAMRLHIPPEADQHQTLTRFEVRPGEYALATVHRAENTDDRPRLEAILEAVRQIAKAGLTVLFPVHPRTMARLGGAGPPPGVAAVKPVGYRDFLSLARHARVGLTDSGGVQKELLWLETPCVTLREETEWVETVEAGWNVLVGTDPQAITSAALAEPLERPAPPPVYGAGHAAESIAEVLTDWARDR
jgi:UDP-GlcNAc3NAcA epimerase